MDLLLLPVLGADHHRGGVDAHHILALDRDVLLRHGEGDHSAVLSLFHVNVKVVSRVRNVGPRVKEEQSILDHSGHREGDGVPGLIGQLFRILMGKCAVLVHPPVHQGDDVVFRLRRLVPLEVDPHGYVRLRHGKADNSKPGLLRVPVQHQIRCRRIGLIARQTCRVRVGDAQDHGLVFLNFQIVRLVPIQGISRLGAGVVLHKHRVFLRLRFRRGVVLIVQGQRHVRVGHCKGIDPGGVQIRLLPVPEEAEALFQVLSRHRDAGLCLRVKGGHGGELFLVLPCLRLTVHR